MHMYMYNSTQASARKDNPKPRDLTLVYFYNKNYTENQQTFFQKFKPNMFKNIIFSDI